MIALQPTWHNGGTDGEKVDASSPGALAHQRDVARIAAKVLDVLLHPVQRRYLIHEAVIGHAGLGVRRDVGVEEAQDAEPIVQGDHYHVGVAGQD